MHALLITILILNSLSALLSLTSLGWGLYPIKRADRTRGYDAFSLVIELAFTAWAAWLLVKGGAA